MTKYRDRSAAEARFSEVFAHFGVVMAYARRRGSTDPEGLAADVMAIAWRRLASIPLDDSRPWLFATARNLLLAEWRGRRAHAGGPVDERVAAFDVREPAVLDSSIAAALRSLSPIDREALLLIAWEDLTPKMAARALGVREAAFRVRLHRARRRFKTALEETPTTDSTLFATPIQMEDHR